MTNSVITNNIFFSASSAALPESWYVPADWGSSLIPLDSLRSLTVDPWNLTEADRHITITNNAYFWPQIIVDKWADLSAEGIEDVSPLRAPDFIDAAPGLLTDKTTWPNVNVENNFNVDPGFDATLVAAVGEAMATFVDTLWHNDGTGVGVRPFVNDFDDPPTWEGVPSNWAEIQGYPVPENLKYSNTELHTAGTDGKALGDLNWFPEQISAVNDIPNQVPTGFSLSQNYPNPFNPTTTLSFTLPRTSKVTLEVFNLLGQKVATVIDDNIKAGAHSYTFDAAHLASGVYFYTINVENEFFHSRKMVLLK